MLILRRVMVPMMLLLAPAWAWGQLLPSTVRNVDKIILKVDNYIVLRSELEAAYAQVKQNGTADKGDLRCRVLDNLAINKMLLAKADMDSVTVEDKMVDAELEQRMQVMLSQVGGRDKLEAYFHKSVEQFKTELRKQVKEQLVVQKMQRNITKDVKVTPAQVRRFFEEIPRDSVPFFSTEVEVAQIVRVAKVGRTKKNEARQKCDDLKGRIEKGEDFATLAKLYSDDPGSAKEGGDLGMQSRGVMVKEFEGAALRLKPNEMTVVESQFGFHLIQLIERRGLEYHARHILIKPNAGELDLQEANRFLDSLRGRIAMDSISFERAAKDFSDDAGTKSAGGFFSDGQAGNIRVPTESLDPSVFFTIDTMKVGSISRPVPYRTEDGKQAMRILYYKSKTPPHEANLGQDYQKIYNAAMQQRKALVLGQWFEKTRKEVYVSVDAEYQHCKILQSDL